MDPSWKYILILSFHLRLGFPSGLFPSGFPTKTLNTHLLYRVHATCPAHFILEINALKYRHEILIFCTVTSQTSWLETTWSHMNKQSIHTSGRLLFQDHSDVFITTDDVAFQHTTHASPLQELPPAYHSKLWTRIQKTDPILYSPCNMYHKESDIAGVNKSNRPFLPVQETN